MYPNTLLIQSRYKLLVKLTTSLHLFLHLLTDLTSSNLTSPHLTSPHLTSTHLTSPIGYILTSPYFTSNNLSSPHLPSLHFIYPTFILPHLTRSYLIYSHTQHNLWSPNPHLTSAYTTFKLYSIKLQYLKLFMKQIQ